MRNVNPLLKTMLNESAFTQVNNAATYCISSLNWSFITVYYLRHRYL